MPSDFKRIDFHDWRLFDFTVRTIAVGEGRYTYEVKFRICSDERTAPTPPREAEVSFQNVRGLRAFLDLEAKEMCYDSVFENFELSKEQAPELVELLGAHDADHLYVLILTHKSGKFEALAQGVTIQELTHSSNPS
jgi:hypothetical protein